MAPGARLLLYSGGLGNRSCELINVRFGAISAPGFYDGCWPGAAVPNVRPTQTMENIGQIDEGPLCGASPYRQWAATTGRCASLYKAAARRHR